MDRTGYIFRICLGNWFSTLLMPRPFNSVPHVVVSPPTIKLFSMPLFNYKFAFVVNRDVNI